MNKKIITIKSYGISAEAHVDKGYLAHCGIWCFLKNEAIISTDPLHSLIDEVELQVKEGDVEQALKLLTQ